MFKKDPDALKCWSLHNVQKCASTQKQLLRDLVPALKVGGTLIYSTCTFATEENEETIDWLLNTYPGLFRLENLDFGSPGFTSASSKTLHPDLAKTRRLFPHKNDSEGFYVAKLIKVKGLEDTNTSQASSNKTSVLPKASDNLLRSFFKEIKLERDCALNLAASAYKIGYKYFFLAPDIYRLLLPFLSSLKPVYLGVHLGDEKKNRLEPAQALALYLSPLLLAPESLFPFSLDQAIDYLRGQEIFTDQKMAEGFKLATFDGFPLGWGNFKQERLKNFFPKSLRNKL
ncbi:MAG: hypothetical protein CVV50_01910 [Spirochaetae bacterium HGW-Spirochaetae-6]|nr:MAG: hypothetical protein CVV50_01910 [Spirochaetae bacterium HGW-Spirochaetae-6]